MGDTFQDSRLYTKQYLKEFIELYKSLPAVWKIKSKEYSDRNKKSAAYEKLIAKLREVEPNATRESVVRKVNNIRSSYRRELKKIMFDDNYVPSLWYFDMLSFLSDQENQRSSELNREEDDEAWTQDRILQLAELLRAAPCLWDVHTREFRDRSAKADAVRAIADLLNAEEDEITRKIRYLKMQFRREENRRRRGGSGEKWFAYRHLTFLSDNSAASEEKSFASSDDDDESDCSSESDLASAERSMHSRKSRNEANFQVSSAPNKKLKKNPKNEEAGETYISERSVQVYARDHLTVYGENVASRLRAANRSHSALSTAKHYIDNILFQLEMGEFDEAEYGVYPSHSGAVQLAAPLLSTPSIDCSGSNSESEPQTIISHLR